jgi:hypothetical protein
LFAAFLCLSPARPPAGEWFTLFNGKDLKNWDLKIAKHALNENYANTFRVENGVLKVGYEGYTNFADQYGHLFYRQKFSYYLLTVEYRFTGQQAKGGPGWAVRNSGIMFHAQPAASMGRNQDFPISIEAQFLGGDGVEPRTTLNLCTPGTHVVLDGKLFTPHCVDSKSKTYHGDGWVRAQLLVLGDSLVQHIADRDTVLTYTKPQVGGEHVSGHDPELKKDGQPLTEGYIALQSESHPVEFRKVELFDLAPYARDRRKLNAVLEELRRSGSGSSGLRD